LVFHERPRVTQGVFRLKVFTLGHKPHILISDWDLYPILVEFLKEKALTILQERQVTRLYTMGRLGWDIAAALAAMELNIPVSLCLASDSQYLKYDKMSRNHILDLQQYADEVFVTVTPSPYYQIKNVIDYISQYTNNVIVFGYLNVPSDTKTFYKYIVKNYDVKIENIADNIKFDQEFSRYMFSFYTQKAKDLSRQLKQKRI